MSTAAVTADAPFYARLGAYLNERFPLAGHGLLIVSYYSSNQFLAHALTHPGEPMNYSHVSLMGALTVFCFFFHLRVFDEHKDYADDSRYHPQRVLQRGLITLADLRRLGAVAIAIEFLMAALRGTGALLALGVAFAFSLLMLKEFFAREYLKRHFLLYATTHMLVMPLLAMVVFGFAVDRPFWEAPPYYYLYAWVGFFVTFNWEVSRKIRAPEEETAGVDSYTKIFGTYGAANLVLLIRAIDTGLVAIVGHHIGLASWFYLVLAGLFAVCLIGYFQFRLHTSPKTARRMETYAGLYIVAFDLTLALAIAQRFGVRFPW